MNNWFNNLSTPQKVGLGFLVVAPVLAIKTAFGALIAAGIGALFMCTCLEKIEPASGICPNCGKPWEKEKDDDIIIK